MSAPSASWFSCGIGVEAAGILRDDPAVAHGIMKGELFPYRVALWSAAGPTRATEGA